MPKLPSGNYPDDLKGIWKNRELYIAFRGFWVRTCPKATLAFIRAGGLESGDKIKGLQSHKMFEMSGLNEKKNPLKLSPAEVKTFMGMLDKRGHMATDTKKMQKLIKEMHRLVSLRSKLAAIGPFYKSPEFKEFEQSNVG